MYVSVCNPPAPSPTKPPTTDETHTPLQRFGEGGRGDEDVGQLVTRGASPRPCPDIASDDENTDEQVMPLDDVYDRK